MFRFCAIPQIMAIATLAECYANPEVFRRVVKIPKGLRRGPRERRRRGVRRFHFLMDTRRQAGCVGAEVRVWAGKLSVFWSVPFNSP